MTTAIGDLESVLAQVASTIRDEALAAFRPYEFRRLWRKTHAAVRAHGYDRSHQRGAAKALKQAFPEYAAWIPDIIYQDDREEVPLPAELERVLGRPVTVAPQPVTEEEETQQDDCDHDDHPWRCLHCNGLHEEDCEHEWSCDCAACVERGDRTCDQCGLREDCDHLWYCEECGHENP